MAAGLMNRGAAMLARLGGIAAAVTAGDPGITVVITRKVGGAAVTVTNAIAGRSPVDVDQIGDRANRIERGEREYLIPVASLVQSSVPFLPAIGDEYAETINGTAYVFKCMKDADLPAWDFTDHGRTQVRVRTKRMP
jgi:hypothetical protein